MKAILTIYYRYFEVPFEMLPFLSQVREVDRKYDGDVGYDFYKEDKPSALEIVVVSDEKVHPEVYIQPSEVRLVEEKPEHAQGVPGPMRP